MYRKTYFVAAFVAAMLCGLTLSAYGQDPEATNASTSEAAKVYKPSLTAQAEATPPEKFFNLRQQKFRSKMRGPVLATEPPAKAMAVEQVLDETDVHEPTLAKATGNVSVTSRAIKPFEMGQTSTVCEPSLAVKGKTVFLTGNWFATVSKNSGTTFTKVDPYTKFPAPVGRPFCCDQIAHYHAGKDVMFWLLQHVNDSTGNILRLAVASGSDIASQQWRYYDFSPQSVGNWAGEWFDFPDLAMTNNFLFITVNTFTTASDQWRRSVAIRIPLSELKSYSALNYRYYQTQTYFSMRAVQGSGNTMYLAAHKSNSTLRVFSWPDSAQGVTAKDVSIASWSDADRVAPGPDGRDWVGRADGRITAGFHSKGKIGFAWSAAQDANRPFPHVRVAIIDAATMSLSAQPHLWNSSLAYAYPAACPNKDGTVGFSTHFGGGSEFYPSHAVGVLIPPATATASWSWKLVQSAKGTHGPEDGKWGDYQAVRSDGTNWFASGYTLQGGSTRQFITPQYIRFSFSTTNANGSLTKGKVEVDDKKDLPEEMRLLRGEIRLLREELKQLQKEVKEAGDRRKK